MNTSLRSNRTAALVIAGTAALTAGLSTMAVLFYSGLARYMHIEDLNLPLSEDQVLELTKISQAEKLLFIIAAVLAVAGLAALIAAVLRSRHRPTPARAA